MIEIFFPSVFFKSFLIFGDKSWNFQASRLASPILPLPPKQLVVLLNAVKASHSAACSQFFGGNIWSFIDFFIDFFRIAKCQCTISCREPRQFVECQLDGAELNGAVGQTGQRTSSFFLLFLCIIPLYYSLYYSFIIPLYYSLYYSFIILPLFFFYYFKNSHSLPGIKSLARSRPALEQRTEIKFCYI